MNLRPKKEPMQLVKSILPTTLPGPVYQNPYAKLPNLCHFEALSMALV